MAGGEGAAVLPPVGSQAEEDVHVLPPVGSQAEEDVHVLSPVGSQAEEDVHILSPVGSYVEADLQVRPGPAHRPERAAVSFEHVSLAFDEQVVLRDVSFVVRHGRLTFLLGASGSGKSVILKLILGLLKPDGGVIRVDGRRIDTMGERELMQVRGDIGMLFQETALFDSITVAENVGYRLREEMHASPADERRRVEEVLGFVGLGEYADRMPAELSGGERRRVAIARAMASRPRLLLLDDPTAGLDPITARSVMDEIVKLRDLEHVTAIVVTHQLPHAFYAASHAAVRQGARVEIRLAPPRKMDEADFVLLRAGGICFEGRARELLRNRDPDLVKMSSGWVPPLE